MDVHPKKLVRSIVALTDSALIAELLHAVWDVNRLKPEQSQVRVHATFRGVVLLPGEKDVLVLVSRGEALIDSVEWFSAELIEEALRIYEEYEGAMAKFKEYKQKRKEWFQELEEKYPEIKAGAFSALPDMSRFPPSTPRASCLQELLTRGVSLPTNSQPNTDRLSQRAEPVIAVSGWSRTRENSYEGLSSVPISGKRVAIVGWRPHQGIPSYSEVRWTVLKTLRNAVSHPRIGSSNKPVIPGEVSPVLAIDDVLDNWGDEFESLLELDDSEERVERCRERIKQSGYEAIAWFQRYHRWTDDTWGIYFDAEALDDLTLSYFEDLRRTRWKMDAAKIAFGSVFAHEFFHAKVEATLSWLEINARAPRDARYCNNVYDVLRGTSGWLEEALANCSAWKWANQHYEKPAVDVVESHLDMSPAGYRDWRQGEDVRTWQLFSSQLITGKPGVNLNVGIPLENIVQQPIAYDLRSTDIPLRFVGEGVVASSLLSNPAIFNVPTRKELEAALKFFDHKPNQAGGKGSHEKWSASDSRRAFILPRKDPVSRLVFKSFLAHVGIDKQTYVHKIRPNL